MSREVAARGRLARPLAVSLAVLAGPAARRPTRRADSVVRGIEERTASPKSLMPDNLHEQMTPQEFLDLIAYLSERK